MPGSSPGMTKWIGFCYRSSMSPSRSIVTIYMPLVDEGTDVWRPVRAIPLGESVYQINDSVPDDEQWAFPDGAKVVCETQVLSQGPVLAAVRLAD